MANIVCGPWLCTQGCGSWGRLPAPAASLGKQLRCFKQLGIVTSRGRRNSRTGACWHFPKSNCQSLPKSKVQPHPEQEVRQGLSGSKSTQAGVPEYFPTCTVYRSPRSGNEPVSPVRKLLCSQWCSGTSATTEVFLYPHPTPSPAYWAWNPLPEMNRGDGWHKAQ